MKSILGLFFCVLSLQTIAQSRVKEIQAYRVSIDSLHTLYDSLYHELTDSAQSLLTKLKLRESIGEGVYPGDGQNGHKFGGGFEVYPFFRADTICRIIFSAGKTDAYVTKSFYYRGNNLVLAELTVRRWDDQIDAPYTVVEYYWQGKRIGMKTANAFPPIKDKSLVPISLFKEGMGYLKIYR